ncbi:MAG: hypothetical protein R3F43_02750 [bacterium]
MSRIAAEAGIATAIYYFEDKLDLLVTAFRTTSARIEPTSRPTSRPPTRPASGRPSRRSWPVAAQENPAWIGMGPPSTKLPAACGPVPAWVPGSRRVAETMRLVEHGQRVSRARSLPATCTGTLMMAINEPLERWFLEAWDAAPDGPPVDVRRRRCSGGCSPPERPRSCDCALAPIALAFAPRPWPTTSSRP